MRHISLWTTNSITRFFGLALLLTMSGCFNPFQSVEAPAPRLGSISINADGELAAQTIMPDLANLDSLAVRRLVEFTNTDPGGLTRAPVDFWTPGDPINDIPYGTWTIDLSLFDGADNLIATGSVTNVVVDAASVPVAIDINPLTGGTGTLQFDVSFPAAAVDTAVVQLEPYPTGTAIPLNAPGDYNADFGTTGTLSIDTTVASGAYALVVRLSDSTASGDGAHAPIVKAVQIFDNLVSTTPALTLTLAELRSPPDAPSNVQAMQIDLTPTVQITWNDMSNTEDGYNVYRDGTLIAPDLPFNTTVFEDLTAIGGPTYEYEVRAANAFGESVQGAATISVRPISDVGLEAPLDMATDVPLRVNFEWDPGFGADSLELYILEDGIPVFTEFGIPSTQGGFSLDAGNQLSRLTSYTWYVVARNADFEVQTPELSFETTANIIRVAPNGGGDGSGWGVNAADFQWAVDESLNVGPVEIWMQAGTYEPAGRPNGGDVLDDRTRHFALRPDVEVYGGFAGTEVDRSERNPELNETIFSGGTVNVTGSGETLQLGSNENNVYHVFYHPTGNGLTRDTILDGVTIEGGNADGDGSEIANNRGGGIYLRDGSLTIQNTTFRHNYAGQGAAVAIFGSAAPHFDSVVVENNQGATRGAIHSDRPMLAEPVRIERSSFVGNHLTGIGGASTGGALNFSGLAPVYVNDSHFENNYSFTYGGAIAAATGVIANSSIDLNKTGAVNGRGGGLYVAGQTNVEVVNTVFHGNSSVDGGAIAMFRPSLDDSLINITVYNNISSNAGGAIWVESGPPKIYNSILWNNTANTGTAIYMAENPSYVADPRDIDVQNTTIQGYAQGNDIVFASANDVGTYLNVDATDPLFTGPANAAGLDGIWRTADDGLSLQAASPAVDTGNTALLPQDTADIDGDGNTAEQIPIDIIGNPRVFGGTVDRGAYEYQ